MEDYEEQGIFRAGKRCGIRRASWMGDWFTSWSPRNDNGNAEGQWAHWANLAAYILSHPATQQVAPHLYTPTLKADAGMYTEGDVLTDDQIKAFFPTETASA